MNELQNQQTCPLLAPQAMTNSATTTARVDTKGADYAVVTVHFAAEANTNADAPTVSLTESDDTVATNFATVTANISPDLTAARTLRYDVDLKSRKRYLKLSVSTATNDTNDNITVAADCVLGKLAVGNDASSDEVQTSTNVISGTFNSTVTRV